MPNVGMTPPFDAYSGDDPYVFVSYSHKDGRLVFPEIQYLHDQGYRIWYDEGIDPGNEWPNEVANALANATMVLVFISPNAVKSRNVRNEINFALNNQIPFIAIHIKKTNLPPGLELRMGDIQAVMKYRMSEDSYRRKMERSLSQMLRTPPLVKGEQTASPEMTKSSGVQPRRKALTKEMTRYGKDFHSIIPDKHKDIVGRKNIKKLVREFIEQHTKGVFLITGEPGIGKTALMANLVQERVGDVYFFYRHTSGLRSPDECLKQLYHQLLSKHNLSNEVTIFDPKDFRAYFEELLFKISTRISGNSQKEVIIIDALDEAGSGRDHVTAIEALPDFLPEGIFFVLSSRPGNPDLNNLICHESEGYVEKFKLEASGQENKEDAYRYVKNRLKDIDIFTHQTTQIADKAEWNFLLLESICSSLNRKEITVEEVEEFLLHGPSLQRWFGNCWFRLHRQLSLREKQRENLNLVNSVLGVIAVANGPVTREMVCETLDISSADFDWLISYIEQYLETQLLDTKLQKKSYRIYHFAFKEFIIEKLRPDLTQIHHVLAVFCENNIGLNSLVGVYSRENHLYHLIESKKGQIDAEVVKRMIDGPSDPESDLRALELFEKYKSTGTCFERIASHFVSKESYITKAMLLEIMAEKADDEIKKRITFSHYKRIIESPDEPVPLKTKAAWAFRVFASDFKEEGYAICQSLVNEMLSEGTESKEVHALYEGLENVVDAIGKSDVTVKCLVSIVSAQHESVPNGIRIAAKTLLDDWHVNVSHIVEDVTFELSTVESDEEFLSILDKLFQQKTANLGPGKQELCKRIEAEPYTVIISMQFLLRKYPRVCTNLILRIQDEMVNDDTFAHLVAYLLANESKTNLLGIRRLIEEKGFSRLIGFFALDIVLSNSMIKTKDFSPEVLREGNELLTILSNEWLGNHQNSDVFKNWRHIPSEIDTLTSCLAFCTKKTLEGEKKTRKRGALIGRIAVGGLKVIGFERAAKFIKAFDENNPMKRMFQRWLLQRMISYARAEDLTDSLKLVKLHGPLPKSVLSFCFQVGRDPARALNILDKLAFRTNRPEFIEAARNTISFLGFLDIEKTLDYYEIVLKKIEDKSWSAMKIRIVTDLWRFMMFYSEQQSAERIFSLIRKLSEDENEKVRNIASVVIKNFQENKM